MEELQNVLNEVLGYATVLAVIVTSVVQLFKKTVPSFPPKYLPLVSFLLGILTGFLVYVSFDTGISIQHLLWAGGIAGLAGVGIFESTKHTIRKMED